MFYYVLIQKSMEFNSASWLFCKILLLIQVHVHRDHLTGQSFTWYRVSSSSLSRSSGLLSKAGDPAPPLTLSRSSMALCRSSETAGRCFSWRDWSCLSLNCRLCSACWIRTSSWPREDTSWTSPRSIISRTCKDQNSVLRARILIEFHSRIDSLLFFRLLSVIMHIFLTFKRNALSANALNDLVFLIH